ncbi:MAG TPA: thioredoxin [Thermoplasmatales archaeon]|nr:thioredoxin [Thermoplasmatales archaeon]
MGEIIESKDKEFKSILEKSKDKLVIVDFHHPKCFPCLLQDPVLEEVSKERDVIIAKHNVMENPRVPSVLKITSVPTLIFVKDNKVVRAKRGFTKKEKLEEIIDEIEQGGEE